jgi:hypothetical protein
MLFVVFPLFAYIDYKNPIHLLNVRDRLYVHGERQVIDIDRFRNRNLTPPQAVRKKRAAANKAKS